MSPLHRRKGLFNVQRLMLLGLMALVLGTSLGLATGVASAKTTAPTRATVYNCTGDGCDGINPNVTICANNAVTKESAYTSGLGGGLYAYIELRYSPTCGTAWAKITFNQPIPSGHTGNALVYRYEDQIRYDCASGGNGLVYPGQTSCYSSMVFDPDWTSAEACAVYNQIVKGCTLAF